MRTSYCLVAAAVLAAAAGAVYTGLPAAATPPPARLELPPVVLDPDATPTGDPDPPAAVSTSAFTPPPTPAPVALPSVPAPSPVVPAVPPPALPLPGAAPGLPPPALPAPAPVKPASPVVAEVPPPPLPAVPPPPAAGPPAKPVLPAVPPPAPVVPAAPAVELPKPALPSVRPPALPVPTPDHQGADAPKLPAAPPPAADPAGPAKPLPAPNPVPNPNQYVLLKDGKLAEGVVTTTADKVTLRRGGVDRPLPADQVEFVGNSKDDVYRFLLARAQPGDAAGRLALARWCVRNGMREQALEEAREVAKLQPKNGTAAEMARTLEESLRLYPGDGSAPAKPPAPPVPMTTTVSEADITAGAVATFGTRVEPLLVNTCGECHAKAGYGGAFKLTPRSGFAVDPDATRKNLRAAAGQVKKDEPGCSPLLTKAAAVHGGMKTPAVLGRQTPAYQALEAWVSAAVGTTPPAAVSAAAPPSPRPALPPPDVTPAVPAPVLPAPGTDAPGSPKPVVPVVPPPVLPAVPPPPIPPAAGSKFGQDAKPPAGPAKPGEPADEFDPAAFNRAVPPK